MKSLYFLAILFLLINCSFDKKSGIWKNENTISKEESDIFKDFEKLSIEKTDFKEIKELEKNYKIELENVKNFNNWNDIFFKEDNNFVNFNYKELNQILFKSKKLSKYKINKFILFENNKLICSDEKGNVIIFSLDNNEIITKYNFYKKKHKQVKKYLNLIVKNNIIYISDNIGYIYAFDYKKDKILWAKNLKIPFRSNLKLYKDILLAANQNNDLIFFNIYSGNEEKFFPTEQSTVLNNFQNNLSIKNNQLFFLNTYGSLYSIDMNSLKTKWYFNFNQSDDINPGNIFNSNPVIHNNNLTVVTSNDFTYIIDFKSGSVKFKKNLSSNIKPIITKKYIFLITKNNFLVLINLADGKILFSQDINKNLNNFTNKKVKNINIKSFFLANNNIFIILENSLKVKLSIDGKVIDIRKLKSKINSKPILINGSILYINNKNKLSIVN